MPEPKYERLDAQFEKLLLDILHGVDEQEFTPEKRAERRALADSSDLQFCAIYYPKIFSAPFNRVHQHIAALKSGKYSISGFPKSGKTAFTFVSKIIKPICRSQQGIYNICLRTQDIAEERSFHIFRLITLNRLLMYDYDVKIQQDKKGYYIINGCMLVSTSVKTGLRNYIDDNFKRFRVSVNDDLYSRISVDSEVDNDKVTDFIVGEVYRQMEDDGLCITLGNRITEKCPIVRLEEKFPDKHFSFPALDANGHSNWPERYSEEDWKSIQKETDWDVWESEYMDRPAEKGDIFQAEWLRTISLNLIQIVTSISAIDPSYGSSPSACQKGIATVGVTDKQQTVLLDMYLRNEPYEQVFDYLAALRVKIPAWKCLLFENDFNQWAFADPYYRDWSKTRKMVLPIMTHYSKDLVTENRSADKESRILTLVHPFQTGMLVISDEITRNLDYIRLVSQYLAFGKSKTKLDGLDALATAYIMVFRYVETGNFKPLRERIYSKAEHWFKGWR